MSLPKDFLETLPDSQYGFIYHYYRAEVYRETNWRNRMDVTTNWAIGTTGAILSLVFTTPNIPHSIILMNFLIVLFFLYIEARRFRYYQILKRRTRLIEQNLLTKVFSNKNVDAPDGSWVTTLHDSFVNPSVPMSRVESLSWRLRRNYMFLLSILFVAWIMKISFGPVVVSTLSDLIANARVWIIPGAVVMGIVVAVNLYFVGIALTIPKQSAEDDLP